MANLRDTPFLERLQFFNGQRLFASDLQNLESFNREMRWLHNQSLHQHGIGNGFEVIGRQGNREVTIMPGYAIDSQGREIVLNEPVVEPVPPVAGETDGKPIAYDLTVSYRDELTLEEVESREGVCSDRGVVRLREEPVFCWVRLNQSDLKPSDDRLKQDLLTGVKIVLARARVLNCQLSENLAIAQRRSARPARQPYVASGTVTSPEWQVRNLIDPIPDTVQVSNAPIVLPVALRTEVDTSAAGFVIAPAYFAHIVGERTKQVPNSIDVLIEGIANVFHQPPDQPRQKRFTLDVLLVMQTIAEGVTVEIDPRIVPRTLVSDWEIFWTGIEGQ